MGYLLLSKDFPPGDTPYSYLKPNLNIKCYSLETPDTEQVPLVFGKSCPAPRTPLLLARGRLRAAARVVARGSREFYDLGKGGEEAALFRTN